MPGTCAPWIACNSGGAAPSNPLQFRVVARREPLAASRPPAIPEDCAPQTPCNSGRLRPLDPLQCWGTTPAGPPAIPGCCTLRTPCNTTIGTKETLLGSKKTPGAVRQVFSRTLFIVMGTNEACLGSKKTPNRVRKNTWRAPIGSKKTLGPSVKSDPNEC